MVVGSSANRLLTVCHVMLLTVDECEQLVFLVKCAQSYILQVQ